MDRQTIMLLISTLPSMVVKLTLRGYNYPTFSLTGIIEAVNTDSIIFTTKQRRSAIAMEKILSIVPTDKKEL